MQDDAPHGAFDPYRDLDEAVAQRRDLRRGAGGAGGVRAQRLDQDVGRQRDEQPFSPRSCLAYESRTVS